MGSPDWAKVHSTCIRILTDHEGFWHGQPIFQNIFQLDRFVHKYGAEFVKKTEFGNGGYQIIWKVGDHICIKIKTAGYVTGPRAGTPTMWITICDGKGFEWANEMYKVSYGMASTPNEVGVYGRANVLRLLPANVIESGKRATGNPYEEFLLARGQRIPARVALINPGEAVQQWADFGHLNLPRTFNAVGAEAIGVEAAEITLVDLAAGVIVVLIIEYLTSLWTRFLTRINMQRIKKELDAEWWNTGQQEVMRLLKINKHGQQLAADLRRQGKPAFVKVYYTVTITWDKDGVLDEYLPHEGNLEVTGAVISEQKEDRVPLGQPTTRTKAFLVKEESIHGVKSYAVA